MTATTDILPIASGGGANVITQAAFAAMTTLLSDGFQSGVADSNVVNKVLRQASFVAAGLANWIVEQGISVPDDGSLTNLVQELDTALRSFNAVQDTSASANSVSASMSPGPAALFDGLSVNVKIANTNTGAATLDLNGFGAKSITLNGNALAGGELKAGQYSTLVYDGTVFEIISNLAVETILYTGSGDTAGTANAQTLATVTPSGYSLSAGNTIVFTAGVTNTGPTTLNISSTGAVTVKKQTSTGFQDLSAGDITSTDQYEVQYNGVYYVLQTGSPVNPSNFLAVTNNLSDVSDAATARTNLGLGTASQQAAGAFLQTANNLSDLANLATALTNLGFSSGTNWAKFPNGLIVNYGVSLHSDSSGTINVTFGHAYTSAPAVVAGAYTGNSGGTDVCEISGTTTTGWGGDTSNATSATNTPNGAFWYIAVGV